jgi:hypothetical protein
LESKLSFSESADIWSYITNPFHTEIIAICMDDALSIVSPLSYSFVKWSNATYSKPLFSYNQVVLIILYNQVQQQITNILMYSEALRNLSIPANHAHVVHQKNLTQSNRQREKPSLLFVTNI